MAAPGSEFGRKFGFKKKFGAVSASSSSPAQPTPQPSGYGVTVRGDDSNGGAFMARGAALFVAAAAVVVIVRAFSAGPDQSADQPSPQVARPLIQQFAAPVVRQRFTQPQEDTTQIQPAVSRPFIQQLQAPPVKPAKFAAQEDHSQPAPIVSRTLIQQLQAPLIKAAVYASPQESGEQPAARVANTPIWQFQTPVLRQNAVAPQDETQPSAQFSKNFFAPVAAIQAIRAPIVTQAQDETQPAAQVAQTRIWQLQAPIGRPINYAAPQDSGEQPSPQVARTLIQQLQAPVVRQRFTQPQDDPSQPQGTFQRQAPVAIAVTTVVLRQTFAFEQQSVEQPAPVVARPLILQPQAPPSGGGRTERALNLHAQFRGVESDAEKLTRRIAQGVVGPTMRPAEDAQEREEQARTDAVAAQRYVVTLKAQIAAAQADAERWQRAASALDAAQGAQQRADALGAELQLEMLTAQRAMQDAQERQRMAAQELTELDVIFVAAMLAEA